MAAALAVLALFAAGCGSGDGDGEADEAGEDTSTTTGDADGDVTVALADSELGSILVDGEGRTLYLFTNDQPDTSTCVDDCAQNWPPLEAPESPVAGEGVAEDLLGSIERDDGTDQVTYAGKPLYHFAADTGPGDTQGQGVGDVWFVVGADGEAITGAASAVAGDEGYGAAPEGEEDPPAPDATETAAAPAQMGSPTTTAAAPAPTTTAKPAATTTTKPAAKAAIRIENFTFSPLALQVSPGTVVTATNADGASHTWTADDDSWDSGTLGQGDRFQHTFSEPGTFSYFCAIHPSMKGTVTVG